MTALEAFALGLPALHVRGFGNSAGPFTYQELSAFAQDDWRVTSRLTLKAGLRYQVQIWPATETTITSVGGTSLRYPFPQDRNNLAPRLGMSFNLDRNGRRLDRRRVRHLPWQSARHHPGLADGLRWLDRWRQAPRCAISSKRRRLADSRTSHR